VERIGIDGNQSNNFELMMQGIPQRNLLPLRGHAYPSGKVCHNRIGPSVTFSVTRESNKESLAESFHPPKQFAGPFTDCSAGSNSLSLTGCDTFACRSVAFFAQYLKNIFQNVRTTSQAFSW
jgi:hypothetical protein